MTNIDLITNELENQGFDYYINHKKTIISTSANLLDIYKLFCDKVVIDYIDSDTLVFNDNIKINSVA